MPLVKRKIALFTSFSPEKLHSQLSYRSLRRGGTPWIAGVPGKCHFLFSRALGHMNIFLDLHCGKVFQKPNPIPSLSLLLCNLGWFTAFLRLTTQDCLYLRALDRQTNIFSLSFFFFKNKTNWKVSQIAELC